MGAFFSPLMQQFAFDAFGVVYKAPATAIDIFSSQAAVFFLFIFKNTQVVLIHFGIAETPIVQKKVALLPLQWYQSYGGNLQLSSMYSQSRSAFNGTFHFSKSIRNNFGEFSHQVIVFNHGLVTQGQPLQIDGVESAGKLLLQVILFGFKMQEVIVIKKHLS